MEAFSFSHLPNLNIYSFIALVMYEFYEIYLYLLLLLHLDFCTLVFLFVVQQYISTYLRWFLFRFDWGFIFWVFILITIIHALYYYTIFSSLNVVHALLQYTITMQSIFIYFLFYFNHILFLLVFIYLVAFSHQFVVLFYFSIKCSCGNLFYGITSWDNNANAR